MKIFKYLSKRARRKHIKQALLARETEWYHYEVDRRNFVEMLRTEWSSDLEQRIVQIEAGQRMVLAVYASLQNRLKEIV